MKNLSYSKKTYILYIQETNMDKDSMHKIFHFIWRIS